MKTFAIAVALATAAIAGPVAAQTLPPAVIVIVDMDQVFNNSVAGKQAQGELKVRLEGIQARLTSLRTQFGTEQQNLAKAQPAPAAAPAIRTAWEAKVRDLQQRQAQAEQELQGRDREFQAARQYVLKQLNDGAQPAITAIMRERNANIVLAEGATLQHSAAIDITNDVVARLDKSLPRVLSTPPAGTVPTK